jgi:hypothetical protein
VDQARQLDGPENLVDAFGALLPELAAEVALSRRSSACAAHVLRPPGRCHPVSAPAALALLQARGVNLLR